jgi:hypothetical protein
MEADRARPTLTRALPAAAASGVLATLPMSAVMLGADALGRMGTQPPRRVVDEAAEQAPGPAPSDATRDATASVLHLVMGGLIAVGVLPVLALARRVAPAGWPRAAAAGGAFGVAVYLLNYAGLAPALGILPPPTRDRPGRQLTMAAAHVVYGVVTGVLVNPLARLGGRHG